LGGLADWLDERLRWVVVDATRVLYQRPSAVFEIGDRADKGTAMGNTKRRWAILLMVLIAALLGGGVGVVAARFLYFIKWGQEMLWGALTQNLPLQSLLITTVGGLLVGLSQRYLGDYPKDINEVVTSLQENGRLDYKHLPKGLITASVSLIFGASLGPEAAIIDLLGGLGTWVSDSLGRLSQYFELPPPAPAKNRLTQFLPGGPNLVAIVIGTLMFLRALNGLYGGRILDLGEPFQWMDLFWSIPLGLVGMAGGRLHFVFQTWTMKLVAPLQHRSILRGMLGGFSLGLTALFLPLVLFSGQHLFQPMYDQFVQLGFWTLFLTALARLFLTNLMIATGWKGGRFLPIMFGGAALGLSISVLFPVVPAPVAVLATMGALVAAVLPRPFIALVLMILMFPLQYVGVPILAIGLVRFGQRLQRMASKKRWPEAEISIVGD
jgi:H+/Cl- antiporter ClcA